MSPHELDWEHIATELATKGFATTGPLLSPVECIDIASAYGDDSAFRSTVVMARHGFGRGQYRYYNYPLPQRIQQLREEFYSKLAPLAPAWGQTYPADLSDQLARCHSAGQVRPTPLLLRYGAGDYNCLHQDLYGELVFPLQVALLLNAPGVDFEGGEFVLVEQRPRQQSRAHVVPLRQGEGVIFAVREWLAQGTRGTHRRALRHGVSTLRSGERHTLGLIFHDAA
jgi:hypothetical protein